MNICIHSNKCNNKKTILMQNHKNSVVLFKNWKFNMCTSVAPLTETCQSACFAKRERQPHLYHKRCLARNKCQIRIYDNSPNKNNSGVCWFLNDCRTARILRHKYTLGFIVSQTAHRYTSIQNVIVNFNAILLNYIHIYTLNFIFESEYYSISREIKVWYLSVCWYRTSWIFRVRMWAKIPTIQLQ